MNSALSMRPEVPDEPGGGCITSGDARARSPQESNPFSTAASGNPPPRRQNDGERINKLPQGLDGTQIQLITRPKVKNDLDPSIGFSYGQRMKINPGQFSRPKPSRAIVPNVLGFAELALPKTSSEDAMEQPEGGSYMASVQLSHLRKPIVQGQMSHFHDQHSHQQLQYAEDTIIGSAHSLRKMDHDYGQAVLAQAEPLLIPGDQSMQHTVMSPCHDHPPNHAEETSICLNSSAPPAVPGSVRTLAKNQVDAPSPLVALMAQCQVQSPHSGSTIVSPKHPQADSYCSQSLSPKDAVVPPSARMSRTSFQNDISVSFNNPPRTIAQHMSPRPHIVSRPLRTGHGISSNANTPSTRARASSIISSNSKRKRGPRLTTSSSPRSLRSYDSRERNGTPSIRRMSRAPDYQLRDFRSKLTTTIVDLTGCLNDKFKDIDHDVGRHIQTITGLKHKIKKQQGEISRYKKRSLDKDAAMQKLEEEQRTLMESLGHAEQELEARSAKVSKLEEKGKSYKDFLNSAISEQQELYKATKSKCEAAIRELKAEEGQRKALQEHEWTKAETAREKLNQVVKATVADFRNKEAEYNRRIESLTQAVQHRDEDILRERETARGLLEQSASILAVQDVLKGFGTRLEDAVLKMDQFISNVPKQETLMAAETCAKIDHITSLLEDQKDRERSAINLPDHIREQIEKAVVAISTRLESLLGSQHSTQDTLSLLCSGLENFVADAWDAIEERQDTIEDYLVQRQDETLQERISCLEAEVRVKESECGNHSQLLLASSTAAREDKELIDQLRHEIMDLEHAQAESFQQSEQLQVLRNDYTRLQQDAATKASLASDLEHKLQEAEYAVLSKTQGYEREIEELRRTLQQNIEESEVAQRRAVETAQQEAISRMSQIKADLEEKLTHTLEERVVLQSEIAVAKQKMQQFEDEATENSDKVSSLEAELQIVRDQSIRDGKDARQKDAEQDSARQQQLQQINDLQTKLNSSETKFKNLAKNALEYDAVAQLVLRNLKQETQGCAAIQKLVSTLDKTKNKKVERIDLKFKPLIQMRTLHSAIIRYCEAQAGPTGNIEAEKGYNLTAVEPRAQSGSWPNLSAINVRKQVSDVLMGSLIDPLRRVTVQSPISNVPSPQPLSVEAEQEHRRLTDAPKSIMKAVTFSQTRLSENAHSQEDPIHGQEESVPSGHNTAHVDIQGKRFEASKKRRKSGFSRGPYNRLVAGSNPHPQLSIVSRGSHIDMNTEANVRAEQNDEDFQRPLSDGDSKRIRLCNFSTPLDS